jgi:hypothetical protein
MGKYRENIAERILRNYKRELYSYGILSFFAYTSIFPGFLCMIGVKRNSSLIVSMEIIR